MPANSTVGSPQADGALRLEGGIMKFSQAFCSSILIDGLCPQLVEQPAGGGHLRVDLEMRLSSRSREPRFCSLTQNRLRNRALF